MQDFSTSSRTLVIRHLGTRRKDARTWKARSSSILKLEALPTIPIISRGQQTTHKHKYLTYIYIYIRCIEIDRVYGIESMVYNVSCISTRIPRTMVSGIHLTSFLGTRM